MKSRITAVLAAAALAATAYANDTGAGTALVTNNHGGYNVVEPSVLQSDKSTALITNNHGGYNVIMPSARHGTLPFFGAHGYAAKVNQKSHEPANFILVPTVQDMGHGAKQTVYHKVRFATAEDAAAAKVNMQY